MRLLPQAIAWLVALVWIVRTIPAIRFLPSIPNLLDPHHDLTPTGSPSLTVIVPARNEAKDIVACLESLLGQDYPNLRIIAIDDRSTDATGALMESRSSVRLEVLHVTELPAEWLGKTHAMALAAAHAIATHAPDFLLFTDADILFAPASLRLALAHAVATRADHLVLYPTTLSRRWDEPVLLSFFQLLGLWGVRPWRVPDPQSPRDSIGIGAFNLLRTSAYISIGGFEGLRMAVVEDLALGRRIKQAGFAQRVAFGRGLVSVHWAAGVPGIIRVMTKNIWAAFNFHVSLLLGACLWLLLFCILPFVAIWFAPLTLPCALILLCIAITYALLGRTSGLSTWNALFTPIAALLFIYTLLRSMAVTLRQGGIVWRGTFYPLADLRRHTTPLNARGAP